MRDQLAVAIVNKSFGDAVDAKSLVNLAARVEENWIGHMILSQYLVNLRGFFIRDSEDHKSLALESFVERIKVRHFTATRLTPGGPKIYKDHFALQLSQRPTLSLQIIQRKVCLRTRRIIFLKLLHGCGELRNVAGTAHLFITHEHRELYIRIRRVSAIHFLRLFAEGLCQGRSDLLQSVPAKVSFS